MKNFSEIGSDNLLTSMDRVLNNAVQMTGLPRKQIQNLYENLQAQGKDLKQINESFEELSKINNITFDKFFEPFVEAIRESNNSGLSLYDKRGLINQMIQSINLCVTNNQVDTVNLLKIISAILLLKNPQYKNSECCKCCDVECGSGCLEVKDFVSVGEPVNISESEKIKKDIQLYESLRDILVRDNERWGSSYSLNGNAHKAIIDYLDNEIRERENDGNIESKMEDFHDQLIKQIVDGTLNPMYTHCDVLKQMVPDLQTYVFDLMLLVNMYIRNHEYEMSFVSRKMYIEYQESIKNLFTCISSSRVVSRILAKNVDKPNKQQNEYLESRNNLSILDELDVSYDKIGNNRLTFLSVVDCITSIKGCSQEFNFNIRPYIRNFCTKSFELMGRAERIILEQGNINKYKNGYNQY